MGRTPFTACRLPSSESSPMIIYLSSWGVGSCSLAARMPIAIGRSYAEPSFFTSAGAMLMITRLPGIFNPISRRAESIRCWLSFTALSGNPTIMNLAPQRMFTSIVMVRALIPYTAPPKILTNILPALMFHIQACKLRLFRLKAMRNTLFLAFYFF